MTIDEEFQKLIPPLTDDEYRQLEENCIKEGIREAILVWDRGDDLVIVDGHNRYKIAREHGLKWSHKVLPFKDRETVKAWIRCNQLGRRNLDKWQKFDVHKALEEALKKEAKERQSPGTNQYTERSVQKSAPSSQGKTRDKMAALIGVSHDTYNKMKKIDSEATPQVKQAVRDGKLSINQAYNSTFPKVLDPVKEAKKEHEAFQEKAKDGVVEFADVKKDKANQDLLNSNLMQDSYKLFRTVKSFGFAHKTNEFKKLTSEQRETLDIRFKECADIITVIRQSLKGGK